MWCRLINSVWWCRIIASLSGRNFYFCGHFWLNLFTFYLTLLLPLMCGNAGWWLAPGGASPLTAWLVAALHPQTDQTNASVKAIIYIHLAPFMATKAALFISTDALSAGQFTAKWKLVIYVKSARLLAFFCCDGASAFSLQSYKITNSISCTVLLVFWVIL